MNRTQVYLSDDELALLALAEQETGASRSELIRRAVRATFSPSTAEQRLAALRAGRGVWTRRAVTGADYVDASRGDLEDRLARLDLG